MNIQQLRYVVATAEQHSMTSAAAVLFVAQPALSRAVRALERELGVVLFERSGRGVVLTPGGERFVAQARRILAGLDGLRRLGGASGAAGLVIAASPTLQVSLALPILAALREQGIAATARLVGCSGTREVHALVQAGGADLGLCDQALPTDLTAVSLGTAEVLLVSPHDTDLPDDVAIADLDGVELVLPTVGTERRAVLDRFFEAHGVRPVVAVESDERQVWVEAVSRGLASCVWHSVDVLGFTGPVRTRSFHPAMSQELNAVHRPDDDSEQTHLLAEVLQRMAAIRSA